MLHWDETNFSTLKQSFNFETMLHYIMQTIGGNETIHIIDYNYIYNETTSNILYF